MIRLLKKLWHRIRYGKLPKVICISSPNSDAVMMLERPRGEVIEPFPNDTVEDLASLMSCYACNHEYPRVIVYPINKEMRDKVVALLNENKDNLYPMYEYFPASIISNEDLNSKTLIYKYRKSHVSKAT